ncbi:MAG: AAC(3) family N-acetyltransferase [Pseudomonadota bacterium]
MAAQHTVQTLSSELNALGVFAGDGVWVHASMRAVGRVTGGAASLIKALLSAVGPEGLIGMPGFSEDAYPPADMDLSKLSPSEIAQIEHAVTGFDVDRSPTAGMGVLAETFRTWPGTLRSAHCTTSVCLNGSDAVRMITPHAQAWATGPTSPFGRMHDRAGMKILLVGVGWNRCTPLHTAEDYAMHKRTKIRRFKTGPGDAPWMETPDVADVLGRLFPAAGAAFEATGSVTRGRLGDAEVRLCGFADLVTFAAHWISTQNEKSGDRH